MFIAQPPIGFNFELNTESNQNKNLIAWYPANWSKNSNSIYNLAYDRAGKGTLSSANSWSTTTGIGYALEFDGSTTTGINCGANATHRFTNEISVTAWVYPRANPAANTTNIIMSISDSILAGGWEFGIRNDTGANRLAFAYYDGGIRGWYLDLGTPLAVNSGSLYHVGFTYKPGTLNFYRNGVLAYSQSVTAGTIVYVSDSTRLGDQTGNFEWNGGIQDIRLYNRYLTTSEIAEMYHPDTRWELYKPIWRNWQGFVASTTQLVDLNAADATAIGYSLTTNYYQIVDKSDAIAIGNDLTTSTTITQIVNKSDALALGYDISIASNITIPVNLADSVAIGYNLTNNYIMSLTVAQATANSTLLNTYYLQNIGQALATAIGNDLNSIYSQPVNSGLAVALGYSITTQVGAVTRAVNLANALAIGYTISTSDFTLILSPERIYKPGFYDRTHIPHDDRIYRIKNYGTNN